MKDDEKLKSFLLLKEHLSEDFSLKYRTETPTENDYVELAIYGFIAYALSPITLHSIGSGNFRQRKIKSQLRYLESLRSMLGLIYSYTNLPKIQEVLHSIICFFDYVFSEESVYETGEDECE